MPIFRQVAAVECPTYERVVNLALPPYINLNAWNVHYVDVAAFCRFNQQRGDFLRVRLENDKNRYRTERTVRAAMNHSETFPVNIPCLSYDGYDLSGWVDLTPQSAWMIKFLIDGGASVFPLCVSSQSYSSDFIGYRLGTVRQPQPAYSWQKKLKHIPVKRHGLTPALTDSYAVSDIATCIEHRVIYFAHLTQNCRELEQRAQETKPADLSSVMGEAARHSENGRDPHFIAGLRYNDPDVIKYLELHEEIRERKKFLGNTKTLKALQSILDQMVAAGLTHASLSNPYHYRSMLEDLAPLAPVAESKINQPEGSDFELIDRFEATADRYRARKFQHGKGLASEEDVDRLKGYLAPLAAALRAHVDMELIGANIGEENLELFADILTEPQEEYRPISLGSYLRLIEAGTNASHPSPSL